MTAVAWDGQINSLTWLLEKMFMEIDAEDIDLLEKCDRLAEKMFTDIMDAVLSNSHKYELWMEKIRPIDLLMAAGRMRGINIK